MWSLVEPLLHVELHQPTEILFNVNVNHQFIYRITANASNAHALNTLVNGKEESLQS